VQPQRRGYRIDTPREARVLGRALDGFGWGCVAMGVELCGAPTPVARRPREDEAVWRLQAAGHWGEEPKTPPLPPWQSLLPRLGAVRCARDIVALCEDAVKVLGNPRLSAAEAFAVQGVITSCLRLLEG